MQCLGSFKFWFRSGSALEKNGSGSRSWTFIQDLMIFLTEEEFELFFFFFHLFFADPDPAIQNIANPTDPDQYF